MTALYALVYLIWERAGWGSAGLRDLLGNIAFMPLNLLVVGLNAMASRNETLDPAVRRALRLLALGSLMVLIGNTISVYYLTALGENPPVSWADPFYLGDSVVLLAAVLTFPLARRTRLERWKFVLDAAMVLLGGAMAIWYFTVRPTAAASGSSVVVSILAFAYPLVNLLLLLGIATVLLRGPLDGNRLAFRLLLGGVLVSIVADLTFDLVLMETGTRSAAWTDAVYLVSYLLLVASAERYYRRPVAGVGGTSQHHPRVQPLSPLPYMAVATTYGLLLASALVPWIEPISQIVVGAVLMTILMVARQLVTVRQNVRLLAENTVRQNEARFRSLVQHSSDVIIVIRPDTTIRYLSPSVSRVLRYDPEPLLGRALLELLEPEDRERARAFLRSAAKAPGVSAPIEWRFLKPQGGSLQAEIIATNLLNDPAVRGIVLNTRDVSERKRLEQQLTHQAFHDPLTGLANRALFRDRVGHALTLARRHGHVISVLFLDLDDFKKVNDSLGHSEGDQLLIAAAERFMACARVSDTVARLGGDEFAILIEDGEAADGDDILVERLASAMARPFSLCGNELHVNASIGIATATGGDTADDLLRNADMAMYTAKRRGKGRCETYQSHMYSDLKHRLEMEVALRTAIERQDLSLVYQPIISLQDGRVHGVEALVRWEHSRYGHLLPQHFVPLAEETGLIVELGRWVLREACQQVRRWRLAHPATPLVVAVNVSGRQLHELDIVEETRQALAESGVDPEAVVLEITESVLMQQTGSILTRLQQLKGLGVRLAIDDFGTGYSSLSYLQRFPIDILKIAKPFVEEVGSGLDQSALARAIIGLGETLNLSTIAEGVEGAEQCAALVGLGCKLGQGYYFSPPLAPVEIDRMLAEGPQSLLHGWAGRPIHQTAAANR
ncbi:MAG: putative bifunctional diguanylate cyclase/phosphodiesterase [Gemmatimonadales bacterium]